MEVKKTFEEPKVEKVEFDFKTRIAASGECTSDVNEEPSCNLFV